jgi:hypothetical protein
LLSNDEGKNCTGDGAVQKAVRVAVADFRVGSERALNYSVGQVMKKTRSKADAGEVHRLVRVEVGRAEPLTHHAIFWPSR